MARAKLANRQLVGHFAVDSGMCVIGDPLYSLRLTPVRFAITSLTPETRDLTHAKSRMQEQLNTHVMPSITRDAQRDASYLTQSAEAYATSAPPMAPVLMQVNWNVTAQAH